MGLDLFCGEKEPAGDRSGHVGGVPVSDRRFIAWHFNVYPQIAISGPYQRGAIPGDRDLDFIYRSDNRSKIHNCG